MLTMLELIQLQKRGTRKERRASIAEQARRFELRRNAPAEATQKGAGMGKLPKETRDTAMEFDGIPE